jgi:hypothetical protein
MSYNYEDNCLKFQHGGFDYACFSLFSDQSLKESDYGLMFLTSPYYQAEEDYSTVYMRNGDKYPIGALIPLHLLEEDDSDYVSELVPYYKRYASLAIRKAISYLATKNILCPDDSEFHLSDYFKHPNVCLFIHSISETGSDVSCIVPSLYDNGYYLLKDPLKEKNLKLYSSSYMISSRPARRSRNVLVKPIKFFEHNKNYFIYLYTELLPYIESPFYRFFSLYQAIELLSDYTYKSDVDKYIQSFKQGKISKNDLREKLVEAVNEKKQIQHVYNNVIWKDDRCLFSVIDSLLDNANIEKPKTNELSVYIYTLRNKIVHEMHSLFRYEKELKDIVDYFEKNIFNLLAENMIKQL